jgi:hypothetical protein
LERCWNAEADVRPSFGEVLEELEVVQAGECPTDVILPLPRLQPKAGDENDRTDNSNTNECEQTKGTEAETEKEWRSNSSDRDDGNAGLPVTRRGNESTSV